MRGKDSQHFRKKLLTTAITASLGVASVAISITAHADTYVWGNPALDCGFAPDPDVFTLNSGDPVTFTMLSAQGKGFGNTSVPKGHNTFQTPTCGTLSYDTEAKTGTADIASFDFFGNDPALPAAAAGITFTHLDSSVAPGGSNDFFFSNMLFNWNGNSGIPVSIAWDAQGILDEMDGTPTSFTLNADGSINTANAFTGTGSIPASDGTYIGPGSPPGSVVGPGGLPGYLGLGPVPLASTAYNATPNCIEFVDCIGNTESGIVPLIVDVAPNTDDEIANPGGTISGSPMLDGSFSGSNANFDFTSMTLFSFTDTTAPTLTMNAHGSPAGTTPLTLTIGTDTYTEPGATCTDAAPLNTNITPVVGGDAVNDAAAGTYNVTYNCQDASSNATATETRVVNVVAAGIPSITILGDNPATHECATTYVDAGATASDLPSPPGDGDISTSVIATTNNGTDLTKGTINEGTAGAQTIDYDAQDSGANAAPTVTRTVNVVDTTNPVIIPNGANPQSVVSSTPENPQTYTDLTASATDSCDATVAATLSSPAGTVDLVVPDSGADSVPFDLIYTVTDNQGNIGSATRTVNVTRSQPVISLVGSGEVLKVGDTYIEKGMDIIDAQDTDQLAVTTSGASGGLTYTIDASAVDTNTEGSYLVAYNATDSDGNIATLVERNVVVGVFASGSNFSMLDKADGKVFGGTNDVVFDWDGTSFNTDESDPVAAKGFMTIASVKPEPFFDFIWTAHHIRIYEGPATGTKTLSFDTTCTVAQLEAGVSACNNPVDTEFLQLESERFISMTLKPGQIGVHILFDWNTSSNIDVVNVWNQDAVWDRHGGTGKVNKLHDQLAGDPPDETKPWKLVSTDFDGDGFNGDVMLDGPFRGARANFNAGPGGVGERSVFKGTAPKTDIGNGLAAYSVWGLLAGFVSLLGFRRFNKKQ